ncbi:hypothetical protein [Streptomyces kronopolitis]|uniref:hypothetical protein n=1 Tax=Streptomyces kronopolitis TaxID=1612435 RepID=UPI0020BF4049|nr:hypothetical protein [Streptomyces kronopolitis]MCL6302833.1 hypothetical protein [Streptomyces kronopolitis]
MKPNAEEQQVQGGRTLMLRLSLPAVRWNAVSSVGIAALIAHDGVQGPVEVCALAGMAVIGMCCEAAVRIAQVRAQNATAAP